MKPKENIIHLNEKTEPAKKQTLPTISGAVHDHVVRYVQDHTLAHTARRLFAAGAVLLLLIIWLAPDYATRILATVFYFGGGVLPKLTVALFLLLFGARLWAVIRKVFDNVKEEIQNREDERYTGATLQGIPTRDLIDFLCSGLPFARDSFCDLFGVGRGVHEEFTENLREKGYLKRGENNALMLAPDLDPVEVERALYAASYLSDLPDVREGSGETSFSISSPFTIRALQK